MWWPPYASTLAVELVRTEQDQFRVRALLDGTPVHSVDFDDPNYAALGTMGDEGLLCITDFERIVEKLEFEGGPGAKL